jgi:hypothetical protein
MVLSVFVAGLLIALRSPERPAERCRIVAFAFEMHSTATVNWIIRIMVLGKEVEECRYEYVKAWNRRC